MRQSFESIEALQVAGENAASPLNYYQVGPDLEATEWEDTVTEGVRVSRVRFGSSVALEYEITPAESKYVLPLWTPEPPVITGCALDDQTIWSGHPGDDGRAIFKGPLEVIDIGLTPDSQLGRADAGGGGFRNLTTSAADVIRARTYRTHLLDAAGANHAQVQSACESVADALLAALTEAGRASETTESVHLTDARQLVDQAMAYIEDVTSPSVAQLSAHVCASRSTLYRSFHSVCGIGPYEFIQTRRLTLLHSRLLAASPAPGRVSREAAELGMHHFGNMARHYRKLFGELPSETLSRRRSNR